MFRNSWVQQTVFFKIIQQTVIVQTEPGEIRNEFHQCQAISLSIHAICSCVKFLLPEPRSQD